MSKQQNQVSALVLPLSGTETPGTGNLVKKYLYHWPLFLLGVGIMMAAAYYYLKIAPPVYPITATLKFKTPTSASGAPLTIMNNSLENLDPSNNPIIVENEIEVLQSKKIIYQVVNNLQLWVNYSIKNGLSTVDLYKRSPVYFTFTDTNYNLPPEGINLKIIIQNNNSFILKDSKAGDSIYRFSKPVKSSFGSWQLSTTGYLSAYIDSVITIKVSDPDLESDRQQKSIKVELENKDAPFVNLSTKDAVPARGKDILNSVMALYREGAQEEKNEQTQKVLDFANARVNLLKQQLDSEENVLMEFKNNNKIIAIDSGAANLLNTQVITTRAINDLDVQLSTVASLENYTTSSDNSVQLPAASGNLADNSLVPLYNQLAALQLQRAQLAAITPKANPVFTSIDNQIMALKNDFREKIGTIKAALLANRHQLELTKASLDSSLAKVPALQKQYNSLMRDLDSKENIYKNISDKREEVALRFASLIPDSKVVDDAHAGEKSWPKALVIYGIAFLLGLGAAAGFLYARESLNDYITSRKQIEEGTEVPVLGELAYQDTREPLVVTAGRSKLAIGEQFRVLRTNLYHLHGNNESGRVTLFTSSISEEGKSFVSSNLAVTLAYASRKTIILGMDLRKPKIAEVFGLSEDFPGISDYLSNSSDGLPAMIRPSGIPGLDVLGAGSILPNPSELLETEKLDELIQFLKKRYDDIIIDTPPIHLVTDALIIARVAQASLYLVRQNFTHKSELDFIKDINAGKRFNKFTIVFNSIKRNPGGYGYGYGNYNYGYYNAYTGKGKWNLVHNMKMFFRRF